MTSRDAAEQPDPRRGLLLLLDVFANPHRAFASIGVTREWLPAFAIVMLALVCSAWLLAPALLHIPGALVTGGDKPTLSAAFAEAAAGQALATLMMWIWTAVILAAVSASGPRSFGTYFALAVNAGLPAALGTLVFALVVHAHGPAGFTTLSQINRAVPDSLTFLEPRDNDRAISFLASFDLFTLWTMLLVAYGLRYLGHVRLVPALVTAFALWLASALLATVAPA